MAAPLNPAGSEHLPIFITAPGNTDVLMVIMAIVLAVSVLMFGIFFFRLHTLPERMAHRRHKLQFEIVAVLGLIALFTHEHIFWIAGLLLALIDFPDFSGLFSRIAGSVEKIAAGDSGQASVQSPATGIDRTKPTEGSTGTPQKPAAPSGKQKERIHA